VLSDAERRMLSDIELRLRTEDPEFARRFAGPGRGGGTRALRDAAAMLYI
jgi:hypothetical protein